MLTKADQATLDRALDLEQRFLAGIFPTGSAQHAHFRKLERDGWLRFDDYGTDIDGEAEREVPVYRLTARGKKLALLLERLEEP